VIGRSETDIAEPAMEWLSEQGFDCYPECSVLGASRPDIFGIRGAETVIVEAKTSCSLALLGQAVNWIGRVNRVYIAVPPSRNVVASDYCHTKGIGWLDVYRLGHGYGKGGGVEERFPARFFRRAGISASWIRKKLHEGMKEYKPGSTAMDGYWSPWRHTMNQAVCFISNNPGASVAKVVGAIQHHYRSPSTAKGCLLQWLERDERVQVVRQGRAVLLYPAGVQL